MKISRSPGILRRTWIDVQIRAMRHLVLLAHRRSKLPVHLLTGERGELEALFYLRSQGYTVVARRWRNRRLRGDLDLIAWDGPTLCFIEIKTRHTASVAAEASIDRDKQQVLRQLARSYLRRLASSASGDKHPPTRFDVLSLDLGQPGTGAAQSHEIPGESFITHRESRATRSSGPRFVLYKGAFSWA